MGIEHDRTVDIGMSQKLQYIFLLGGTSVNVSNVVREHHGMIPWASLQRFRWLDYLWVSVLEHPRCVAAWLVVKINPFEAI